MFCADADGAAETVRSGEGGLFALMHLLRVSELPHLFRPLSTSPFLSPFPPSVSFSVRLSVLSHFLCPPLSRALAHLTQGSPLFPRACVIPTFARRLFILLLLRLWDFCLLLLLHHSQLPFPALGPLCLRSLCQESGAGGCFKCVFASSPGCMSLASLLLSVFPSAPPPFPPPTSCDWAPLVRIGTIHARLFRQTIECRGCLCAAAFKIAPLC